MADFREDEQQWFVIGAAWNGDSTVNCQNSNKPNIYARVSHYVNWIYNRTGIPPVSRPTTEPPTERPTELPTERPTNPSTEPPTDPTTEPPTEPQPKTERTTTTEDPNAFSCKYLIF